MKLRYSLLLLLMTATAGLFAAQSRAADKPESEAAKLSNSLNVEVNSERPSNVYWDSETMDTHNPILLSWRVGSNIQGSSRVEVWWRVLDADGKRVMNGNQKYDIENGSYVAGRQLFSPKKRGAYLWVVRATIKLKGPDLQKISSMPLAVIHRPQSSYPQALSVNSAATDAVTSDFQRRIGAFANTSPSAMQFPIPADNVNAAARRRIMWYAKSQAGNTNFELRDDDSATPISQVPSPHESANALAQNAVMAQGLGSATYCVSLNPQQNGQITFSSESDNIQQLIPWERASAFAATNHLLSGTHFVKELFPNTPAIYAALFQSDNSSIATIWSNQDDNGTLKLVLPNAVLLDADGNQVDKADKNGNLKVPLRHELFYVQAEASPDALSGALLAADIAGIASVRAQVLPFTQPIDGNYARALQVRLQNITPHSCSGILSLDAPAGWKLENDAQQFILQPGEWHLYNFTVTKTQKNYSNQMDVKVRVNNGVTGNWSWSVNPPVATAVNWPANSIFTLDGSLDDWKDATWMQASNDTFDRKAAVAVRWDNQNLYIAAKVHEPRFTPRPSNDAYRFWNSDSIQLGFGWSNQSGAQPSSANFQDTDYGILLTPFAQNANGSIDARILTLWNPTTTFGKAKDPLLWGGTVYGSNCRIIYDSKKKEATYEAVIPLSALGDLNPQSRAATATSPDQPIRFSWIAHTFDGVAVQWSQAAGVFPWWGNSSSFLPVQKGFLAAQTLLGFSQSGYVINVPTNAAPPANPNPANNKLPPLPPMPPQQLQQPAQPIKPMNPSPPQNQVPSLPNPVPVQPIPPNLLPPAPPEK